MMMNMEIGDHLIIAKPHRHRWGWMLFWNQANGTPTPEGVYTDPAKMMVKICELLFSKIVGDRPESGVNPKMIYNRNAAGTPPDYYQVQPHIKVEIYFPGLEDDDRSEWSTDKEKEELAAEKIRIKTAEELAK